MNPKIDSSTGSNTKSGLSIPIIAGAVGGAVLFFIVLFCVVFICWKRQSRKKQAYHISTVQSNSEGQTAYNKGL